MRYNVVRLITRSSAESAKGWVISGHQRHGDRRPPPPILWTQASENTNQHKKEWVTSTADRAQVKVKNQK